MIINGQKHADTCFGFEIEKLMVAIYFALLDSRKMMQYLFF